MTSRFVTSRQLELKQRFGWKFQWQLPPLTASVKYGTSGSRTWRPLVNTPSSTGNEKRNLPLSQTENGIHLYNNFTKIQNKTERHRSDVCVHPSGPPHVGYLISIHLFDSLVRFLFFLLSPPSPMIKGHYDENAGRGSAFCGISEGS